jgi:hypothetical protein
MVYSAHAENAVRNQDNLFSNVAQSSIYFMCCPFTIDGTIFSLVSKKKSLSGLSCGPGQPKLPVAAYEVSIYRIAWFDTKQLCQFYPVPSSGIVMPN